MCITGEVPFEIPDSWEWIRLGSFISLTSGQDMTPDKYNSSHSGIPYITGASNIDNDEVIINRWTDSPKAIAYEGDLLLTCKGTVGTMAFLKEKQVHIARQVMAISSPFGVNLRFVRLYLDSYVTALKTAAKSMIPGISRTDVLKILFPLLPENEQIRILQKHDDLVQPIIDYNNAEQRTKELNDNFPEKLKKSILQWAVQGKLVPQDPSGEPASILLEHIREEKDKLIKEGELKKDKNESTIFRRDNSHYEKLNGKERCINDEISFEIPDSWNWVRLGTIVSVLGGKRIPAGRKLTTDDTGHIYIRVSDMKNNSVLLDNLKFVPEDIYPSISRYIINKEAVYITVAGTIGTVGKIPPEIDGANLTENADRLVFANIDQDWLIDCLSSGFVKEQIFEATTKVGQPKLAIKRIQDLLIPLPPLEEQSRIVGKIDELNDFIKSL